MAYRIDADTCIGCGACESECPAACITEDGGKYIINESDCTSCGTCGDVCPVGAPAEL